MLPVSRAASGKTPNPFAAYVLHTVFKVHTVKRHTFLKGGKDFCHLHTDISRAIKTGHALKFLL